ncbi:MAG: YjbQ family protein [Anaerolineales bacterium]|nr:YjbQ family protein [Anaerolineales bacterium]
MEQIEISTRGRQAFHDITQEVQDAVRRLGVQDGVCFVFCPHTSAALTLNENWDVSVQHDISLGLDEIAPPRPEYHHSEGNAPAHIKSVLVGASQFVPVSDGRLVLGTWQGLYLVEFDGPRHRKLFVKVIPG